MRERGNNGSKPTKLGGEKRLKKSKTVKAGNEIVNVFVAES